jgi:phosphatidylinositol-bisphosphatase
MNRSLNSYQSNITPKSLDTGDEFVFPPESSDVPIRLAFADTLLRFLNSLPEAVVPASLHSRCVCATDRDEAFEVMPLFI